MRRASHMWWVALCIAVALCICVPVCVSTGNMSFDTEKAAPWNEGWQLVQPDGAKTSISLPYRGEGEGPFTIVRTLPQTLPDGMTLRIRTSQQTLTVSVEGQVLFSIQQPKQQNLRSPGSAWQLIRIPQEMAGKEISLTFDSPFANFAGILNAIVYGSKSAVMYDLWHQYGAGFLLSCLIALCGTVLIAGDLALGHLQSKDHGLLWLGLFAVLTGWWLLTESRMLQFFIDNAFVVTRLVFYVLMLFPIPLVQFVHQTYHLHWQRRYRFLLVLLGSNFLFSVLLQWLGICDMIQLLALTHTCIGIVCAVLVGSIVEDVLRYKNQRAKRLLAATLVFSTFGILELVAFYTNQFNRTSFWLRLGILCFILFVATDAQRVIRHNLQKSREAAYYEKMAYQDFLTKGHNQAAYLRDVEQWCSQPERTQGMSVLFFDLNNLKTINDTCGHAAGDEALIHCYHCILKAFGTLGECYRVGGDEFVALLPACDARLLENAKRDFCQAVAAVDTDTPYPFEVAMGQADVQEQDEKTFAEALRRADRRMYQCKSEQKEEEPRI